jgi:hypothetical protein
MIDIKTTDEVKAINVRSPISVERFVGPPGPPGKPFTFDDFTQEQLESLRGPTGPAPDVAEFMVKDELEQIIIELRKINGGN